MTTLALIALVWGALLVGFVLGVLTTSLCAAARESEIEADAPGGRH